MESKITINKFQCCQYGLKWVKHAQYLIIFLLCWGFLVYEIFCALEKYLEKDTGTADEYVLNTKTKFPALTICPSLPYKEEILHRKGILGTYLYYLKIFVSINDHLKKKTRIISYSLQFQIVLKYSSMLNGHLMILKFHQKIFMKAS